MPLQNRVTPLGEIVAVPQRGMFTGNRGIIHDPATRTLLTRRWSSRAWIACVCEFRGWRRAVMARQSWTELFFLDEATALAAGHRPPPRAKEMDDALHGERLDGRVKRLHPLPDPTGALPDGAMVCAGGETFLIVKGKALYWSFDGYRPTDVPTDDVRLITPPSTLRALRAGYRPVLHPSAVSFS